MSASLREDLRKLDQIDKQTRFLGANHIETIDDLYAYRGTAGEQLKVLTEERTVLRNKLKRVLRTENEDELLAVKKEIAGVTAQLKELKTNLKTCDSVERRSISLQVDLEALRNEQQKEELPNELFGRSGRTSCQDVPERD